MPVRAVKDLDLYEVSILDRTTKPAYEGNLITARSENDEIEYRGEPFIDNVLIKEYREEKTAEKVSEQDIKNEPKKENEPKKIDYSKYENIINEMKGDFKIWIQKN